MTREKWAAMRSGEWRINIAKLCGWVDVYDPVYPADTVWIAPNGKSPSSLGAAGYGLLPYYETDLNAMHEAVLTIKCGVLQRRYTRNLLLIHGWRPDRSEDEIISEAMSDTPDQIDWRLLNSTAAQRAEAFVLTLVPEIE